MACSCSTRFRTCISALRSPSRKRCFRSVGLSAGLLSLRRARFVRALCYFNPHSSYKKTRAPNLQLSCERFSWPATVLAPYETHLTLSLLCSRDCSMLRTTWIKAFLMQRRKIREKPLGQRGCAHDFCLRADLCAKLGQRRRRARPRTGKRLESRDRSQDY